MVPISTTSSARSDVYSTSRMIHGLAQKGDAPQRCARLSRTEVLLFSCMFLLADAALLYAEGGVVEAFNLVRTSSALCLIFVWSIILVSYRVVRSCMRSACSRCAAGRSCPTSSRASSSSSPGR